MEPFVNIEVKTIPADEKQKVHEDVVRLDNANFEEELDLITTNQGIYLKSKNFGIEEDKRINDLKYIVTSSSNKQEYMLYFVDDTCIRLRINSEEQKDFINIQIVCQFSANCQDKRLKLYKVPETSLQMYMPIEKFAGKRSSNLDNEPCEEYRIRDKEVATVEEYEAEKKRRM